jgi:plastocyanin
MVRRSRLIAQLALLGILSVVAFPASGSAVLQPALVTLTATGPSPGTLTIPAGYPAGWMNQDSVTHTVTFANGRCSIQVPPGSGWTFCPNGFASGLGDYPYTVDGSIQASIDVVANGRTVTLAGKRHTIERGSLLKLHGRLAIAAPGSPPVFDGPRMPVTVLARPDRHHAFHRIAVVTAKPHHSREANHAYSVWHLLVRPGRNRIYIAEARSQPPGGQYWKQAWSRPFRVRLQR